MNGRARQALRGFVLLPVVIALALIATASVALNRSAALEANMTARSLETDAARYAAEAGLNQMRWELQKNNCDKYQGLNDVAFGPHRFTVTASRSKGQPIDLVSTATTASGGTVRLDVPRAAVFGDLWQATLQPLEGSASDTYVDAINPTLNYGASDRLHVRAGRMHALLRFDLSVVPESAKIESAQLWLFQAAGSQGGLASVGSIAVHRVTRPWAEGTGGVTGSANAGATYNNAELSVAWTKAGGDFDPEAAARTELPDPAGWRQWDIADLVQQWVDGAQPNHGLALVGTGNIGSAAFVASRGSGSYWFPMLTVRFRPMCGYDGQPVTKTFNAKQDAGVYSQYPTQNYGAKKPLTVGANDRERMLLLFDVNSIPEPARIQSARLRLNVDKIDPASSLPIALRLHAVTVDWKEGKEGGSVGDGKGATWNQRDQGMSWATRGGDFRAQASATVTLPSTFSSGKIELDIKALVQEWVAKATPNQGLILMHARPDVVHIDTREEGGSSQPQLVVTY